MMVSFHGLPLRRQLGRSLPKNSVFIGWNCTAGSLRAIHAGTRRGGVFVTCCFHNQVSLQSVSGTPEPPWLFPLGSDWNETKIYVLAPLVKRCGHRGKTWSPEPMVFHCYTGTHANGRRQEAPPAHTDVKLGRRRFRWRRSGGSISWGWSL